MQWNYSERWHRLYSPQNFSQWKHGYIPTRNSRVGAQNKESPLFNQDTSHTTVDLSGVSIGHCKMSKKGAGGGTAQAGDQ